VIAPNRLPATVTNQEAQERGQPCRSFQHAHDTVAANGEIDVLDPAGYGALTISKSISIQGHGYAGLAVPSGDGITINTAGVAVNLRGLLLDGVGSGNNGIIFNSGASLNIQDSVIRNLQSGISFKPSGSTASSLFVSDTLVSDNAGNGIIVEPTGSGVVTVVLERVQTYSNAGGIDILGGTVVNATVSDSVSAHNNNDGIYAQTFGSTNVMIRNSPMAYNGGYGLLAENSVLLRVTRSTITGNATGWGVAGATLSSYGDNNVDGNATDGTASGTILLH
jgi:hypothetical protein